MRRNRRRQSLGLGWVLYVMMTRPENGDSLFKIGITQDLAARVSALQTGCPHPILEVLYLQMLTKDAAARAERELHQEFVDKRTSGEWFRFRVTEAEDKTMFHDTCRKVVSRYLADDWKWKRASVPAIKLAMEAERDVARNAAERAKIYKVQRLMNGSAY